MGPVDFKNTIYAGQKDLLTLLESTPGKRKEWFLRALGIDFLKAESEKILKDLIDAKSGELQHKEGELGVMAGRLDEAAYTALQASVIQYQTTIAEHTKILNTLTSSRTTLAAHLKILAEKKTACARLFQQQQALQQERDAEQAQAKKLKGMLALLAQEEDEFHRIEKTACSYPVVRQRLDGLREKRAEHLRLSAELDFASREIADLTARTEKQRVLIHGLDADAEKKGEFIARVRAGLGTAQEIAEDRLEVAVSYRLAEINKRSGTLGAQLRHFNEERQKILADQETIRKAGSDGTCPLCRQKLGSHFGDIDAEFTQKLQELTDKSVADLEKLENLSKEMTAIESLKPLLAQVRILLEKIRQKPLYESELAELEAKREKKEKIQQEIIKSIVQLQFNEEECLACEREMVEVQKVQLRYIDLGKKIGQGVMVKKQLDELGARIIGRDTGLAKLATEITEAAFDPEEASKTETAVAKTEADLRTEEVLIAGTTKDIRFAEEKIADYKKGKVQIAEIRKLAAMIRDEIELMKLTRSLIGEYVVYLMQVVRSRLEGEVSRIISEITGGRYEQVLLDEDFNLLVRDIDNDYPIDRFSGGEQDDIAVALRIALSRYLAELHQVHESTFLIFDEIFGSQDEERRVNLLTALRTQESRFPQILLISHIAEMQGEFANTLVIEMAADGSSRVKEVT
jgi:exonuclease SbcC